MPAKFGEISYPLLLKRYLQIPLTESTATLITARMFDFVTIALILPATLLVFWVQLSPWVRIGSLIFIAAVLLIGIGLLWYIRNPSQNKKNQLPTTINRPWVIRLREGMLRIIASLQAIDRRQIYLILFSLTITIWLCVLTNLYFIMLSLGYSLTFFQIGMITIIMVPISLLPLQGFANLGTHEIGWIAAFALFGYSNTTALTIAVSSHIVLLLFVLLLGFIGTMLLRFVLHSRGTTRSK
jgi:uncharacterized protein (TIRG00374 family)